MIEVNGTAAVLDMLISSQIASFNALPFQHTKQIASFNALPFQHMKQIASYNALPFQHTKQIAKHVSKTDSAENNS